MPIGDRIAIAGLATALAAVALGAWLLIVGGLPVESAVDPLLDPFASTSSSVAPIAGGLLVVDVEGAVVHPGIIELAAGSRVADAIRAVGGYAPEADLAAAAAQVNLAALLRDGEQIVVPAIGSPTASSGGGTATGGLVDLNSASPEALDGLPGIGPVTVDRIVAARAEQPFATLDELVTRKVLTNAQLTKIRDLVTLG